MMPEVRSQKSEVRRNKTEHISAARRIFLSLVCVLSSVFCVLSSDAKIYIDISSPAIKKLPVSISTKGPFEAKEIEWIVRSDLDFTGIFSLLDPDVPGAEMTVQLEVEFKEEKIVTCTVNDLIENKEIFKKQYIGKNSRAIAHTISNDIYKIVTGNNGVFRTAISYLVQSAKEGRGLYLMEWDGANAVRLISSGLTTSHSWSGDGLLLLYSAERANKWAIYYLDMQDFREKVMFTSKGLNIVGGVSPKNEVSFSSSKDGSSEIYVAGVDGSNLRKLTRSFGIDVSPVFSPDGSKIAFVSDRGGSPQIYVMDSNGGFVRRITFEGSYNTSPAWSPDGKWIAYVGQKDSKNQLFMIQSDSSVLRQLTLDGNNETPSFSPDGLFLAFDSDRDGSRGIYIMRTNGGEQRRITPKNVKAMSPKWSPYLK
ncbi:MAG: PD40 domain-containing protein [Nitrospirae bacterium]|nr:PD40 domain-containing protein [Nitrospirota bacterium]